MRSTGLSSAAAVAVSVSLISAPATAQWFDYSTPGTPRLADGTPDRSAPVPRTADGRPDLSGVWRGAGPLYRFNIAPDLEPEDVQPVVVTHLVIRDSAGDQEAARRAPAALPTAQGGERGPDGRRISARVEPFTIVGNIHYVGGTDMTVFLITTPEGHILIDSTYERDVPWIRQNIEALGFDPRDIGILLNSHAHGDHIEAHSLMKELTGAQVVMSEADGAALSEGGGVGADGQPRYTPVTPDRIIRTGDTVTLGGTTLTAHIFPGHTRGATTWTTVVDDGGQRVTFVFWGGLGGVRQPFVNNTEWPTIAEDYAETLRRAKQLPCEFFTEGHTAGFGFMDKMNRLLADEQPNPFRAPEECREGLEELERNFQTQLARERAETRR